jgi:hypothetical protein
VTPILRTRGCAQCMRDRGMLTITPNGPRGEQHARRFELRSLLHRLQLSTDTFTCRSNCEVRRAAEGAGTGTGTCSTPSRNAEFSGSWVNWTRHAPAGRWCAIVRSRQRQLRRISHPSARAHWSMPLEQRNLLRRLRVPARATVRCARLQTAQVAPRQEMPNCSANLSLRIANPIALLRASCTEPYGQRRLGSTRNMTVSCDWGM